MRKCLLLLFALLVFVGYGHAAKKTMFKAEIRQATEINENGKKASKVEWVNVGNFPTRDEASAAAGGDGRVTPVDVTFPDKDITPDQPYSVSMTYTQWKELISIITTTRGIDSKNGMQLVDVIAAQLNAATPDAVTASDRQRKKIPGERALNQSAGRSPAPARPS